MTLLLRSAGRTEIARSLYRDIYNENDFFYFFVGRTTEWDDEESPEVPVDSPRNDNTTQRNMLFVKRIQASDAVLMISRINWVSETIYDQYDDKYGELNSTGGVITAHSGASSLKTAQFYALTDDDLVYKCIFNNNNSTSTVKPTGTSTLAIETADGYIWKFMFKVEASDKTKFLTPEFIPVRKIAGSGDPEFDVNGQIDSVNITNSGSGYATAPTVVVNGDGAGAVVTATVTGSSVSETFVVTVVNDGTANIFVIDGVNKPVLNLVRGGVYTFNQSNASNNTHQLAFKDSAGASYTVGVVTTGTPGTAGAQTVITVANNAPDDLRYYCVSHGNYMGNTINVTNVGEVTNLVITNSGEGYSFAYLTFSGGSGTGASASVTLGATESGTVQEDVENAAIPGTIDRLEIIDSGVDYVDGDASVSIVGDGSGAEAILEIDPDDGTILAITITNQGTGYTFADVTITGVDGSDAIVIAVISPRAGHGANAQKELFATTVGLSVNLINDNADLFLNNDFRQIGVIKNPLVYDTSTNFQEPTGTCSFIVTTSSPASYDMDNIITTDSGGKFIVVQKVDANNDGSLESIYLLPIIPIITSSSILTNVTQSLSGLTINSVIEPEVSGKTGEILYLDNREFIVRQLDQVEKIRAILNF